MSQISTCHAHAARRRTSWLALALLATSMTGCGVTGGDTPDPSASALSTVHEPSASLAGTSTTAKPTNQVTKLLTFVVENSSYQQLRRQMPFVRKLGNRYGYATRYYGVRHPSLPNYLAILGGSTFGVADDDPPAQHRLRGPSVFGAAVAHGSSATLYAERMPTPCARRSRGRYAVKHNAWAYFADEHSTCRAHDLSLATFAADTQAGALPAVGMVIPDLCNDAHDCSLRRANRWLRRHIKAVLAGPDWASGRLAVVVTADEDDGGHLNRVLAVVAHPSLRHVVVKRRLDHLALSRAYADVAGVRPLRESAQAPSMLHAFGLVL